MFHLINDQLPIEVPKGGAFPASESWLIDTLSATGTSCTSTQASSSCGKSISPSPAQALGRFESAFTLRNNEPSAEFAIHDGLMLGPVGTTSGAIATLGGLPIKLGDNTIGGIGVSGAPGGENDEACAQAGIDEVAEQLK
jgi:uncharacterized protein GlcG (DUF336 family)